MDAITIKIKSPPVIDATTNTPIIACEIYGQHESSDYPYMLKLTPSIYKGTLAELKKHNIPIDNNLNCLIDKIFTITHKEWNRNSPPKELWLDEEMPVVYGVTLRTDLCSMETSKTKNNKNNPKNNKNDTNTTTTG